MFVSLNKIRVVVLDFDCTITLEHTGGRADSDEELTPEYIKANIKSGFTEFVHQALGQGIALWIATYGDDCFAEEEEQVAGHALVKRYMDVLFGPKQKVFLDPKRDENGDIVKHRNVIARLSGDRKKFHWNIIQEQMGTEFKPSEILFLDDSASNLDFARELGSELLVSGSSDKAALVCASEQLFSLLLDRMRIVGVADEVE